MAMPSTSRPALALGPDVAIDGIAIDTASVEGIVRCSRYHRRTVSGLMSPAISSSAWAQELALPVQAARLVPSLRREVQDQLVCAYDRLHAELGVKQIEFCTTGRRA